MQMHATNTLYMHLLVLAELISQQQQTDAALSVKEAQIEIELAMEWAMACRRSTDDAGKHNYVAASEPLVAAWLTQSSQHADDHKAQVHSIRSEEHTSELQSLMRISYADFCLKKKH